MIYVYKQALTNQHLSNVHSHTPVLQYLLTYFHIKIFVCVHQANILVVFLANKSINWLCC